MRYGANGEALNVAGERVFTLTDAIEVALSAAIADVGITLSESKWLRFSKNASSELVRQLRKTNMLVLDADLTKDIGTQAETTNHLLRILIAEVRAQKQDNPAESKPRKGSNNG